MRVEFTFEQKQNGWEVHDGDKVFVYTSLQKAMKNTYLRVFYKKPHPPNIKTFKLIFELTEKGCWTEISPAYLVTNRG